MIKSFGFLASILILGGALSAAACTTTVTNASNGSCANIAGTWATTGTCGPDTCVVTQNGCNTGFQCGGAVAYSGSVSGDSASYSGVDAAGDQGSCQVTVSGTSFAGTCTVQGTTCSVQGTETSVAAGTGNPGGSSDVDAGGTGASISDTCSAAHPCECPAGATCDFQCDSTEACTAMCAAGSTCDLACASGTCTLDCDGATCNQTCASGTCEGNATGAKSLHQTCAAGSCDLDCDGTTESCVQIPSAGTHTCEGCK